MKLILKGFIIGIGKIMPGVSGAMLAITLNEYDNIINNIAEIRIDTFNKMKYLSKIGLGIILAIITMSNIIVKLLNKCYIATMLLFIAIITSKIPKMIKKTKINIKDIKISIICLIIIEIIISIVLTKNHQQVNDKNTIIKIIEVIGIGGIDAVSSIIPGISGTAILMHFGYYDKIINTFATISNVTVLKSNLLILIPFVIGFTITTILMSKLLNELIKNKTNLLRIFSTILMIYTTSMLIKDVLSKMKSKTNIILGLLFFIIIIITSLKIQNIIEQNRIKINKKNIL